MTSAVKESVASHIRLRLTRDLIAGTVVFLVALPLCLGIALASNAPLFSGLVTGIVGGIVVGLLSGSHTSVSGPAAGLTAVVAAQLALLGSFEAFLLAVVIAGLLQIALGIARMGFLSAFFPSSVIKGLLAAIGVIIILKQIPHLLGHDIDPVGEMAFRQPDQENTFSELMQLLSDIHPGSALIGLLCLGLLLLWNRIKALKKSLVPAPLLVVLLGVGLSQFLVWIHSPWAITAKHLVQVPIIEDLREFNRYLFLPDFSQWLNPNVYWAAITIAALASLETLLNLQAIDKLDPLQRSSPPNRELIAQGVGNLLAGLLGGLPMTSVILRSSVNINAGAQSKVSTIFHGVLLLLCVLLIPHLVNLIPLACLAAILLDTGIKLVSPAVIRQEWEEGPYQFIPFAVTLVAIVFTDLLIGVLIGLGVSLAFILRSNLRRPLRRIVEKHLGGEVLHIELANQVSFLNRGTIEQTLRSLPPGSHVLLDATYTDYIDPDILDLLHDFKDQIAPAHGVRVSFRGFRKRYQLNDHIQYIDYSTRELQEQLQPADILLLLKDGNDRFCRGERLSQDLTHQRGVTARGQHPLAVILSCADSRTPAELIFDAGLGELLNVRIAGNVSSNNVLGSLEYGVVELKIRLILVMGHTRCGAVNAAINYALDNSGRVCDECSHLESILEQITCLIDEEMVDQLQQASAEQRAAYADELARKNVFATIDQILRESPTLAELTQQGRIAIVGAMYDLLTGKVEILPYESPVFLSSLKTEAPRHAS
jgi:carbonic anhydrase